MKILNDNVLVEFIEPQETKKGNIIILKDEWALRSRGRVVEVGPGTYSRKGKLIKTTVKKDDVIVFPRNNFYKTIKVDDNEYIVISENDILYVEESITIDIEKIKKATART